MYRQTEEDFAKIFKVIDGRTKHKKYVWDDIAKKLNKHFDELKTSKQWKKQYEEGKKRLAKYGSPLLVANQINKSIVNDGIIEVTVNFDDLKKKLKSYIFKPKTIEEIEKYLKVDHIQVLG